MAENIFFPEEEVFVFPVSFAQQRLWFLDQLVPGNAFYNAPTAVLLKGPLNVAALLQTFNEIVRRHEVLRTAFNLLSGELVQMIAPRLDLTLPVVDLQTLSAEKRESQIQRLTVEESQRPFDLAKGPLLRVQLLKLDDTEHILLLTMHHIIADGWSLGVLIAELGALYSAFTSGQPCPLSPLPVQYADFTDWQRQWLQGEVLTTQLTYWRQQLHDLSVLNLPTDRPRPPIQSYRGATQYLQLSLSLSQSLQLLSQQQGVTLFITLLAAFQTLLYRYTDQEDIAVGSPIANRNRREIEGLIGFFVNSLVLRTDFSGNPTFQELLQRVREVALGAYAHQDLPFERLVEKLQPQRDLSHMPLFQVMFALQSAQTPALELAGLDVTFLEVENTTAKFDLTLHIEDTEQGLKGSLEYNTDLFDATTIKRMLEHLQILLEGVVADPEQRISSLPLLSASERYQLLVTWNDTQVDYPNLCIHQLFEAQTEQTPEAIAVVFQDEQLTYHELNIRSNKIAHYLLSLGIGPDVIVAICCDRSLEMIMGLLGILKAGAAYLPLDPTHPQQRLNLMLSDSAASVLLTQQHLLNLQLTVPSICIDSQWHTLAQYSQENPNSNVTADHLVYAIYTSGSTGQPKAVAVEHRSLLNLVFWHQKTFSVSPTTKATQIAAPAFDACAWEIWPYLAAGASIYLADQETRTSPTRLRDWLLEKSITISFLPTPLAERVIALSWPENCALKTLLTGGDKLQQYPHASLPFSVVNNYGPTESTVVATSGLVSDTSRVLTIGRPIANTQVYLLDSHLQPVPIGASGELYIAGDGLARGYLNYPTSERFISHPFSQQPEARLYKTGDVARYLPDGNIQFLGRKDSQVKLRGFRIELGEVAAVLAQHPGVRETVVIVREGANDPLLVAYVVLQQQTLKVSDLRCFLKEKLPEYMVPSTFMVLQELPLTPNGKVDRRALPEPDTLLIEKAYAPPQTNIEEVVVEIWAEVLGTRVGIHDNFFELGGHSLLATQLISRIRDALQVDLPLHTLFEIPTAAGMAEYIETIVWVAASQKTLDLTTSEREEVEF